MWLYFSFFNKSTSSAFDETSKFDEKRMLKSRSRTKISAQTRNFYPAPQNFFVFAHETWHSESVLWAEAF
jgi:hypothetical protein